MFSNQKGKQKIKVANKREKGVIGQVQALDWEHLLKLKLRIFFFLHPFTFLDKLMLLISLNTPKRKGKLIAKNLSKIISFSKIETKFMYILFFSNSYTGLLFSSSWGVASKLLFQLRVTRWSLQLYLIEDFIMVLCLDKLHIWSMDK